MMPNLLQQRCEIYTTMDDIPNCIFAMEHEEEFDNAIQCEKAKQKGTKYDGVRAVHHTPIDSLHFGRKARIRRAGKTVARSLNSC